MKIKMTEHYQDASIVLQPEQVAEVDDTLGAWLVKHRKAYEFVGGKIETETVVEEKPVFVEPEPEEIPVANTADLPKRSKRSK